jgi:hypothetical protein
MSRRGYDHVGLNEVSPLHESLCRSGQSSECWHAYKYRLTISEHWWTYLTSEPCDCRDSLTHAVEEVNIVIKFNSLLTTLSKHPEADNFARGLGPISLGKTVKPFAIILLVSSALLKTFFVLVMHSWRG